MLQEITFQNNFFNTEFTNNNDSEKTKNAFFFLFLQLTLFNIRVYEIEERIDSYK